jgi:hypothetical protein
VLAAQENQWEHIVSEQIEEEGLSVHDWKKKQPGLLDWGANTWEHDLKKAEASLTAALNEEQMKVVGLSRRQLELVEKERELWGKEKAERRREKRLAKLAKKEAGDRATAKSKTEPV